ncbi:MAG: phosphoribosylformylglycinamidine cyclo-ligase [Acidobacteriota bacterium]
MAEVDAVTRGRGDTERGPVTYASAGVDIDRGNEAVARIKARTRSTFNRSVLADIGLFGGLYRLGAGDGSRVLVSSCDGVGTKLKLAFMTGIHGTVGQDLVNHCVNDILVQGARPLFFLDYLAMGRLDPKVVEQIVAGMAVACRETGTALIGGETAEMPEFYPSGEYDLAGFIVGLVDRRKLIDGTRIRPGDRLLGLPSTGLHTNGFTLARKIFFELLRLRPESFMPELGATVAEALMAVHRAYHPLLQPLLSRRLLHGLAHITGGGFYENIKRILPRGCRARIRRGSFEVLPVFKLMQEAAGLDEAEMHRTFNMGVGMVLIVGEGDLGRVTSFLSRRGETYYDIGEIVRGPRRVMLVDA